MLSVPTSWTTSAETLHLMVADSATTPSSSSSQTLWSLISPVWQTDSVTTHLAHGWGNGHRLRWRPPRPHGRYHCLWHLQLHCRHLGHQPHHFPLHPFSLHILGLCDHNCKLVINVRVNAKLVGLVAVSLPSILSEPCISSCYHQLWVACHSRTPPPRSPGPPPAHSYRWVPTMQALLATRWLVGNCARRWGAGWNQHQSWHRTCRCGIGIGTWWLEDEKWGRKRWCTSDYIPSHTLLDSTLFSSQHGPFSDWGHSEAKSPMDVETSTSLCLYFTPFTFYPTALLSSLHSKLFLVAKTGLSLYQTMPSMPSMPGILGFHCQYVTASLSIGTIGLWSV